MSDIEYKNSSTSESVSINDLAAMTVAEAEQAYRHGSAPQSLKVLDGAPRGRLLVFAGIEHGFLSRQLRAFAKSRAFPWAGKSFESHSDETGQGGNRLRLLPGRELFKFVTRIEPSAIDGQPCIVLDYDIPSNPRLIRGIRDELRQVGPDLFFGPALWRTKKDPRLILYFAVETR